MSTLSSDLNGDVSIDAKMLRVAAVQPICKPGPVADNLAHLESPIAKAAAVGAELVLLPERFPEAFLFNEKAWMAASPKGGKIETWLTGMARQHGIYLGGSYLEARDDDFFNTFILASPDGEILGRVGKDHPCSREAYTFRPAPGPQVIDTPLGRIGVAICYDNSRRVVWDRLLEEDFDLLLMPMCAPVPKSSLGHARKKVAAFHDALRNGATLIARQCGVPVIMSNKAESWDKSSSGLRAIKRSCFPGFSHIADSDGQELARLDAIEGIIVADVLLDPARKRLNLSSDADSLQSWEAPVSPGNKSFSLFEFLGRRSYQKSRRRVELARRAMQEDAQ